MSTIQMLVSEWASVPHTGMMLKHCREAVCTLVLRTLLWAMDQDDAFEDSHLSNADSFFSLQTVVSRFLCNCWWIFSTSVVKSR